MHTGATAPDGRIKMWEIKLCVLCTRMIILNHEVYQKVYIPESEGFIYAHEECPPLKFFSNLLE